MHDFVGIDWGERHHDVCVIDPEGQVLAKGRVVDGLEGFARVQELIGRHADDAAEVVIGVETDRGLLVESLVASGYEVFAINPFAASRYRDRHVTSGAKSDPGDAKVLADVVRTDRQNHRRVAGDSPRAEAIKVLARAHQRLIWARQRHLNGLRSALREYYPAALLTFGTDMDTGDAVAVLSHASAPAAGRGLRLSTIERLLRNGGRQRRIAARASEVQTALRTPQLEASAEVTTAYSAVVRALLRVIVELNTQITTLEAELTSTFEVHADTMIIESLPGIGPVLGARALAEFGDDPTRYCDAKARKAYAGTAPITRASGTHRTVLARVARNRHLADMCFRWAYASLRASPAYVVTTMITGAAVRRTTRVCEPSPIAWSASSMVAWRIAPFTTKQLHGQRHRRRSLDSFGWWDVYRNPMKPAWMTKVHDGSDSGVHAGNVDNQRPVYSRRLITRGSTLKRREYMAGTGSVLQVVSDQSGCKFG